MRLTIAILFLTITCSTISGQNNTIRPVELDSLYVKALNSRVDLIFTSGWNYVEMNEYGKRIKDLNVSDRYKFVTNKELIKISLKKRKTISVLRVLHKIVDKDTIDINFGIVNMTAKRKIHFDHGIRFKKSEFTINCGGTNGYQPDIRFVFDLQKNTWKTLINRFITPKE